MTTMLLPPDVVVRLAHRDYYPELEDSYRRQADRAIPVRRRFRPNPARPIVAISQVDPFEPSTLAAGQVGEVATARLGSPNAGAAADGDATLVVAALRRRLGTTLVRVGQRLQGAPPLDPHVQRAR